MTDVYLDQIEPEPIVLKRGDGAIIATIPGELPVQGPGGALELTRIFAQANESETFLLDTPETPENAAAILEAQDALRSFYEQAAEFLQGHAVMATEGALLELTATQIVSIVSMLVAPPYRLQLLANAFMMVMGMEIGEDGQPVPLDEGSPATSSPSDEPEDGKARTGASSRGASSSRSARKPSKPKP